MRHELLIARGRDGGDITAKCSREGKECKRVKAQSTFRLFGELLPTGLRATVGCHVLLRARIKILLLLALGERWSCESKYINGPATGEGVTYTRRVAEEDPWLAVPSVARECKSG